MYVDGASAAPGRLVRLGWSDSRKRWRRWHLSLSCADWISLSEIMSGGNCGPAEGKLLNKDMDAGVH